MKTGAKDENRFDQDASRYAAYLETTEGRLRADLALANVQEFLPSSAEPDSLRALDLGCGTGAAAIRLAHLGMTVTALDSSARMLELADRAMVEAGVKNKIAIERGEMTRLGDIFQAGSFDVILCHNVLEFLDDPLSVLRAVSRLIRSPAAILSVLVRNQAGEVLKAALQSADLAAAEHGLTETWGNESLYGGKVRLFTPQSLEALLRDASFAIGARRGVRVIADYLPPQISRAAEYKRIFALERKLGKRPDFFGVARYLQCLASWSGPASEEAS